MKEYLWGISEMILTGEGKITVRETCPSTRSFTEKFIQLTTRALFFSVDLLGSIFRTDKK